MKHAVRTALVAALMILGLQTAKAADMAQPTFALPLTQGHWMYDANASFTNIGGRGGSTASVAVMKEYFLIDHLSLGGTVGLGWVEGAADDWVWSVSPSATFYFWEHAWGAPFIAQSVGYYDAGAADGMVGSTSLGFRHFFNQHVAFSPRFTASYGESTVGSVDFIAGFSLFY